MADDKTKKDYRDKTRINMNERDYRKDGFGVTGQALPLPCGRPDQAASRRSKITSRTKK